MLASACRSTAEPVDGVRRLEYGAAAWALKTPPSIDTPVELPVLALGMSIRALWDGRDLDAHLV